MVWFTISLYTCGYISLGDPTWQDDVSRKILLNTNSWYLTEALESMHTLFLPTKSAAARLFHWYSIKLMILSTRNNIILLFEPFWNLNRWLFLKKRVCSSIVVLISFLHATFMKIRENDSTHEIQFFYFDFIDRMGLGGGNKYLSNVFLQKHRYWIPCTGLKCLNVSFICYATHLPEEGGGLLFLFTIRFIYFLAIYTYKLFQAFPQKHM